MKFSAARLAWIKSYSQKSQKARLIHAVRLLSEAYQRPICAKDLDRYFKENPEERPLLLKRLCHQLISAARDINPHLERLHFIGFWKNSFYYASAADPIWKERWNIYLAREKLNIEIKRPLLESVFYLRDGIYGELAQNSARGWIQEVREEILPFLPPSEFEELKSKISELEEIASPFYCPSPPDDLISRKEASQILSQQSLLRREKLLSLNRHLVELAWPSLSHFKKEDPVRYSRKMIEAYMTFKWPLEHEDPIFSRALFETLRFGTYGLPQI